jgi:hypothetical protein
MKNQYFGDIRDLFKYDLVLELLLRSSLRRFTFIPMLTEDEPNTHGGRVNYNKARAGTRRVVLRSFLEKCLTSNRRNIKELEKFFSYQKLPKKIKLKIYERSNYFRDKTRKEYFSAIDSDLLTRSVILVDPDIGLEVKSMRKRENKYVKYEEVKLLYDRMDKCSMLLVFQFIPRVIRKRYFSKISKLLKQKVVGESPVYYISDNQVVFFIVTKDLRVQKFLEDTLHSYAHSYGLIAGKCDTFY